MINFNVPNGNYTISSYQYYDVFGEYDYTGFDVVGHLIELKK